MTLFGLDILLPLAASFGAPGIAMAGVLLALIPIIIHILNRRRHKVHKWAAMQYLLEALRRNRRRLQFENWLLLLMRCFAILLIGFALARPLGCSGAAANRLAGQSTRLHVIVLDNSASAAYQVDQADARTVLDRGKRLTEQLIRRLAGSHDAVCIIAPGMGEPGAALAPSYDMDESLASIGQLQQVFAASDLPVSLKRALSVASENSEFTSRKLYLITGATRPAWQDATVADSLRQLGPQLAAVYDITHIDVGEALATNGAVSDIRMLASIATTAMPVDFAAKAAVPEGSPASLLWQSGPRVLGTANASAMGPDHPEQVLPQISFPADGPTAILARLDPPDRLPEDDQRSLAFSVRKRLDVLVAESDRGSGALQSPGTFLQMALAPNQSDEDSAKVEVISESDLANRVLVGKDAIALAAPSSISPADAEQIRHYVEDGGTLIVFMGEGTSIELCNSVLLPLGLMPGKIASIMNLAEGQDAFRFDFRPDANLHPLLRVFRGQQNSGLSTARVWTYARVDVEPRLSPQRVLDFVAGDPAITVHSLGRGKVAFFATSADIRWTSLPAKTAFVALIHELLLGTVSSDDYWRNLAAGSRLEIPRRVLGGNQPALSDPQGRAVLLEPVGDDKPQIAAQSVPLTQPGLYRLQLDGRSFPISVAFPASESDLTHVDGPAIKKALGDVNMQQAQNELSSDYSSAADRGDFGWPLLLAALLILGGESFLAMWFRR